jgi:hypothetical protein
VASPPSLKGGISRLVKALTEMATDNERTAEEFMDEHDDMDKEGFLFRFNVLQGLESVGMNESSHLNMIVEATKSYLQRRIPAKNMEDCVRGIHRVTQCRSSNQFISGYNRTDYYLCSTGRVNNLYRDLTAATCAYCHDSRIIFAPKI